MLALVDEEVSVRVLAVGVIVRTQVELEAGAVNPMRCVEGSRDEVGVRGLGSVQRQCRVHGGSDTRGLVCVCHGGH